MASTHTLTGNVYDLTGATLGATGVRVTVVTNLPAKSALIDKTTNSIHLGGKHADLDPSTGLFTIDLIDTSATDLNVAANTLEYEVRAEYVNPATRVRSTWTSGWFPFTADANLADITTDVEPLAVQSASEYAAAAAASAAEAEAISGLTGEDAAVAFLVEDSGSATAGALSATIGAATTDLAPAPVVAPPTGFTFATLTLPTIRRLGGRRFVTDLDTQALRPPAGVTYYVATNGSAGNSGLSAASPLTIAAAFAKTDVGTIIYAPGEYTRDMVSAQTPKSINHLAAAPGVKITGWNAWGSTTWTLTSGSIYQTTRSATVSVVDLLNRTSWGDYTTYEKKTDLASITGPGQWAIVGSTVYVWALNNLDLSVQANRINIRLGIGATQTGLWITGGTSYARGIDFEGQSYGTVVGAGRLVAEDCTFRYTTGDAINVSGGAFVGVRCEVSSTGSDGASYNNAAEFIEIDCRMHHNGHTGTTYTNNASTAHLNTRGIRVGGDYDVAGGPVVADVNSARTWNLGCRAGDSTAPVAQAQSWRADATGYEGNPAIMWLDECTSDTADNAYGTTGGGTIHVHAERRTNVGAIWSSSTGTVDFYTPA